MALDKTLRYIVLGGIFALPLIVFLVTTSLFFPFITGKNFAFRIIVEVITGAWLALALINPVYRPRRLWLLGSFATFIAVIAFADALGVNPFKSFWSNFERMDGWVTLAHLFLYFVVASAVLSTEKLWRTFFQVSLAVSAIVALHGFLQLFGFASLNPGFSSTARLDATFGNPIYLAAYMLFHVFLAALLLAHVWREKVRMFKPEALLYIGVILLDTVMLFLTGTRGAIIGFVGGAVLAVLLFALSARGAGRMRLYAISSIVLVVLLAGSLYLVRDQTWVQNSPVLGRLATISLSEGTAQARVMNWGTAWKGFKERPILGWGQENFAIVFNKYYNPRMYAQEQWFDRVHNVVFDWLVAGGILGLLAYLSLFAFALRYIWRRGTSNAAFTLSEQSILTGLLAAYFFHNLFVFDNIMSYVLFISVLAFIAFRAGIFSDSKKLFSNLLIPKGAYPIVAALAIVLVWGGAWFVNAKALAANKALLQALAPHQEGILKNLEYFEKAISYGSYGTQESREQFIQATAQLARIEEVPIATKQKFVETAAQQMFLQAQNSPLDPRFPLFLGSLLNTYGLYTEAQPVLERARQLSPTKQTILFELAANSIARNDLPGALQIYKQAYELEPNFKDARMYYAMTAIRAGQENLAEELLQPLVSSGRADAQVYFTLAAAYHAAGNSEKAIEQLEAAAKVDPNVKEQAEALIQNVKSGTRIP